MTTITDIAKNTYTLTFNQEPDYNWLKIVQVFATSESIETDLTNKKLINQNETREQIDYWQDLFFMEVAEYEKDMIIDASLLEKINTNPLFKANKNFINQLPKASIKPGRQSLIESLIENENADALIPDNIVGTALKKKSRDDLRKDFKDWDKDAISEKKRFDYIKFLVAAILIIGFFIWQPTQSTDKELFAYYKSNLNSLTQDNFGLLETETSINSTRGDDFILENYSKTESEKAISGLNSFKEGNYDKAKRIFIELTPKEHNKQILFFLALAQLNTNELDASILNLEYLLNQSNFSFSDDVKFHLAIAYLKHGDRNKSQHLFKELIANNSKFKKEAKLILKKMRWF